MKLCYSMVAMFAATCLAGTSAQGALSIFGETVRYTGPGVYSAQVFVQAVGQEEAIGGFSIEVDASSPNITFNSLVYNPNLETTFPVSDGADPVQFQATDIDFNGIGLADGEVDTLATLTFTVNGPADARISLPFGIDSVTGLFFNGIPTTITRPISFQTVPEPSGIALCAVGALGYIGRRRRR